MVDRPIIPILALAAASQEADGRDMAELGDRLRAERVHGALRARGWCLMPLDYVTTTSELVGHLWNLICLVEGRPTVEGLPGGSIDDVDVAKDVARGQLERVLRGLQDIG
jgi:hypothetical protein